MNLDPLRHPPYLDRRLDRWKIVLLLCLLIVLLLGALFWSESIPSVLVPQHVLAVFRSISSYVEASDFCLSTIIVLL